MRSMRRPVEEERGASEISGDLHCVPRVVLPAVHVGVRHLEDLLTEFTNGGAGDSCLPDAGGPEQKAVLGTKAVLDGFESVRHLVHVPVSLDDRVWKVVLFEDRSIAYHVSVAYHVLVGLGVSI